LNASNDEIAAAHFLLATAYYMENKSSNMRQEIDRTLQLSPDHLFANLFKTRLNLIEGDLKAFSNRLSKLEKLYPDNEDVKFLLAKQAALDHKYPRAISILTELSKNVQHRNITMELAKNYWQSGDKDNSISELKGWLRNHPDDTPVEMLLAQFYINNKSNDKAMALYQKIIEKQPENVVILNNLAWLYLEKNPAKGMEYAASALKLMPDNALIEDTMASLALKNGDRDKALEFSAAAAAKLPDNVDVQLNYSRALVANGSQEKARRILQKLLKKSKDIDQKRLISKELDSIK
jgi:predicted Zn-dependent protease